MERNSETDKKSQRKISLAKRADISDEKRREMSDRISEYLDSNESYKDSLCVLVYADYNNEVETDRIVLKALLSGKEVYMPKVKGREMEFYRVFSVSELEPGSFGIREPLDIEHFRYEEKAGTICLLPLACFDDNGNRIGYGGGFYDKYLSRTKVDKKIGLAFACQHTEVIECDDHDIRLDMVVTEEGIKEFGGE